jgi:hypothetical protein
VARITAVIYEQAKTAEEFRAELRPEILAMRRNGLTFQAIADYLNKEKIPTPSGVLPTERKPAPWHPFMVSRVLKAPNGLNLGPDNDQARPATTDGLPLFQTAAAS